MTPLNKKQRLHTNVDVRPVGQSKANKSQKATREALACGVYSTKKQELWKEHLRNIDLLAEFDDSKVEMLRHVWCSNCGKWQAMPDLTPSKTAIFRKHHDSCKEKNYNKKKANSKMARTSTLTLVTFAHIFSRTLSTTKNQHPRLLEQCLGLSKADNARIPQYLKRSCAPGGGAHSVTRITSEFFTKPFSELSDDKQENINVQQRHEHQWQNDHQTLHMFLVRCMATCLGHDQKTGHILPCRPCTELLNVCSFLTIINIPTPSNENYKYINKQFQNPIIGEQYAKVIGLKELLDAAVSSYLYPQLQYL